MTIQERLVEIFQDEYDDADYIIKCICYGDYNYKTYSNVGLVEEERNNSEYYWIIRVDDKFYQVDGYYASYYGTDVYADTIREVKKVKVEREEWQNL